MGAHYNGASLEPLVVSDDFLAADQFRANFKSRRVSPEMRLMFEVLMDAVEVFFGRVGKRRYRELVEVEAWIADDNESVFGFRGICDALGMDGPALRAGMCQTRSLGRVVDLARRSPNGGVANARPSAGRYYRDKTVTI